MSKRKILALALTVAMIAILAVGGTLAYFTDTEEATNVFTMGNVDITLDEAGVEKNGDEWTATNDRVQENEYEDVYPGAVLPKDPIVHNVGSYDAYVRAKVTVDFNKLAGMQADKTLFNGKDDDDLKTLVNINTEEWAFENYDYSLSDRTVTYTYTYKTVLAADTDTAALFTPVTIPAGLTNEEVAGYGLDEFEINVVAEAIQTTGFDSAVEAWAAFDAE